MQHFHTILEFQKLLKKFNKVTRDLSSIHTKHIFDNDVEHSYRVAMLCWMINEEYKLKLNTGKILMYALAHDLVEVYAGDVSLYKNTHKKQINKEDKEHKSFMRLKKEFPKLKTLWQAIENYEKRKDKESRFVYMVEKLEPVLVVILSESNHWKKRNVGLEQFIEMKQRKIKDIDTFAQVFNKDIMNYLKNHKKKFYDF